ncbi:MAG: ABC transporter ATP-binding protein [Candidatus Thermoplasmatota archaeon]|nr:ABC transporter ATP-binding protein [Candidatus Thermoplasmatota archaeon]
MKKFFDSKKGTVKAVNDVSINVIKGETLGVVGESGCGKTTLGRTILKLIKPTSGKIYFDGKDITNLDGEDMRSLRKKMNIVFQDPVSALNPQMTVYDHLNRPLVIHNMVDSEEEKLRRMVDILNTMGLKAEHLIRYPHELSGGQKQRVCIARALCLEPDFLVLDEPTSALDVSVQSKILKLLDRAKRKFKVSYMFISHNINLVRAISDRLGVMYLGKLVEIGDSTDIFNEPKHPYTQALFKSVPQPDPDEKVEAPLTGQVPSPVNPPEGCAFAPRCPRSQSVCERDNPDLIEAYGRKIACHRYK